MATLKMATNDGNNIWLPNVKRLEQMYFFQPDTYDKFMQTSEDYPWEVVVNALSKVKEENSGLYGIIQQRITSHENHSALTKLTGGAVLLLLYVVLDTGDDVRCQNWLVEVGRNYLLENGKTIDRI